MSLNADQKHTTAEELKINYERLDSGIDQVIKELDFTKQQFEHALNVTEYTNGYDVWKLHDYLIDKLKEQGKKIHSFSILKTNVWFPYIKTW